MQVAEQRGAALVAEARAAGIDLFVFKGRLVLRGPVATQGTMRRVLMHEAAVMAALQEQPMPRPEWSRGGGDHDQPYTFGRVLSVWTPGPFTRDEYLALRRLRDNHKSA